MKIEFIKEEDNKWFAIIPEWTGSKAELQMVSGADTMLDLINLNTWNDNKVTLDLYVDEEINQSLQYKGKLDLIREDFDIGGGWYKATYINSIIEQVWLCDVTKFIYGYMPNKICYNTY